MKFEYNWNGLSLRMLDETYAKEVLTFYNDNKTDFEKYEGVRPDSFYTTEYMGSSLKAEYNAALHGNYVRFFLFAEDMPGKILGTVSFSNIHTGITSSCVIGYKMDRDYRRLGLGSEMVRFSIDNIMKKDKHIHRIEAYIHPDNTASIGMVQKLGFMDEGLARQYANLDGTWTDHLRFVYI